MKFLNVKVGNITSNLFKVECLDTGATALVEKNDEGNRWIHKEFVK